jgi:hypothetical protein
MKEQMIMDLNKLIDALLKDIEAEARQAEAQAKANGERITSSKAHKRAIDTMIEGTERK